MNPYLCLLVIILLFTSCTPTPPEVITGAPTMGIISTAYKNTGAIPTYYTCYGASARVPFQLLDIPQKTKSLALTMIDPDAPGKAFLHWTMWNIPPNKSLFPSTEPFSFPEGTNSKNTIGYTPPCPSEGTGTHRYILSVYALDDTLSLPTGSTYEDFLLVLRNHILDRVSLVGIYEKNP